MHSGSDECTTGLHALLLRARGRSSYFSSCCFCCCLSSSGHSARPFPPTQGHGSSTLSCWGETSLEPAGLVGRRGLANRLDFPSSTPRDFLLCLLGRKFCGVFVGDLFYPSTCTTRTMILCVAKLVNVSPLVLFFSCRPAESDVEPRPVYDYRACHGRGILLASGRWSAMLFGAIWT